MPLTGAPPAIAMAVNGVDMRRATGEWVTGPVDHEPMTRRAHPTLVRTALAEAEERARDKLARSALVTHVATVTRPKHRSTAQRLRAVTPLPPEVVGADAAAASEAESLRIAELDARETQVMPPLVPALARVDSRPLSRTSPETRDRLRPSVTFDEHDDYEAELAEKRRGRIFLIALIGALSLMLLYAAL